MNKKIGCFFASEKGKEKAWRNFWLHKNIVLEGDFYKNVMLHKKSPNWPLGGKKRGKFNLPFRTIVFCQDAKMPILAEIRLFFYLPK